MLGFSLSEITVLINTDVEKVEVKETIAGFVIRKATGRDDEGVVDAKEKVALIRKRSSLIPKMAYAMLFGNLAQCRNALAYVDTMAKQYEAGEK